MIDPAVCEKGFRFDRDLNLHGHLIVAQWNIKNDGRKQQVNVFTFGCPAETANLVGTGPKRFLLNAAVYQSVSSDRWRLVDFSEEADRQETSKSAECGAAVINRLKVR